MERITFTLEITMPKMWFKKFIQMLDCMKWCSKRGASRVVAFYAEGDGNFRNFDFKVDGNEIKTSIDYNKFDFNSSNQNTSILPPFKTKREVDFFFDAS